MKTEINYSHLEGKAKHDKAIEDCKQYLGVKKFQQVSEAVRAKPLPRRSFVIQLSLFVGIEGYPAEAWADELGLPAYTEAELKQMEEDHE